MKLIASFKRMRRFTDYKTIIEALKESEALELGGDEGDETIKRKVPLPIGAHAKAQAETKEAAEPRVVHDKALRTSMYAVSGSETLNVRCAC